jgi:hypothetical protein
MKLLLLAFAEIIYTVKEVIPFIEQFIVPTHIIIADRVKLINGSNN